MAYAGDLKPTDAWKLLAEDNKAQLVDVRTRPEWMFVGLPDLTSLRKKPTLQSWQVFPAMDIDGNFAAALAQQIPDRDAPILFLCRSGARSRAAAVAMTQQGYSKCYNVAEGFEGNLDAERHRGRVGGWKAAGLPWAQE
ncbi:MAG TPA: rhodanese-like domain-containing protein [Candidatus Polarisedimenticolia bacterium]|jgi:rhodanese-related sulfurtransferase|nr:rhodanese-like domain-containing protein [Dongiaceae bacterium]HYV88154.1 rhodanese-like domain-containing protein [Candidatus Polarisedimenticolia bacterium]